MRAPVRLLALLPMVIATVVVLATPPSVRAHGAGEAMLTVSQVVRPGALLEVSGADFSEGASVDIGVSSGLGTRHLSTVTAGPDGHFFDAITVPQDVAGGIWEVRARDSAGMAAVATVVVDAPLGVAPAPAATGSGPDALTVAAMAVALVLAAAAGVVAFQLVRRGTAQPSR